MKRVFTALALLAIALLLSACASLNEQPAEPDYLGQMEDAAMCGDTEAGHLAEYARNHRIDETGSGEVKIAFDDLYLLARLIYVEAGDLHMSDEQRMCVGEVVLNRVASPEYPDSLAAVVYQDGQYPAAATAAFQTETFPNRVSAQTAMRLLLGERVLTPAVVIQSHQEATGEVYAKFCNRRGFLYTYTYFCASPHPELYAPLSS
ncbi:MAG: cell wall hydrolase [Oscillospiraceae bacterium]|nr:cell wall hydrolase [Oscillospiraceae bacterium]